MASAIPAPRILITSTSPEGKSIVGLDTTKQFFQPFGPNTSAFTTLHSTDTFPASNTATIADGPPSIPNPSYSGTVMGTSDFAPGGSAPLHRTQTLDYAVVLKGEIVSELEDGVELVLKEGDTHVQRGTLHAWHNRTDGWTRVLFVMIAAEKVVAENGTELGAYFPERK